MDISLRVPGFEKLVDYAASGIGSIAGPMLAPWKAVEKQMPSGLRLREKLIG